MSLKALLEETVAASVNKIPPEAMAVIVQSSAELDAKGVGNSALKAGDTLPDATLTDANGKPVSIASLLEKGPLIINFYRGGWCPYCNFELKAYQGLLNDIQSLGGQLVAITPEQPDNSLSTIETNELKFPVLTDNRNEFAQALGLAFELPEKLQKVYAGFGLDLPGRNADSNWVLPIPATLVIKSDGEIVLSHVDRNYTKRLEPSDALAALKASLSEQG